MSFLVTDIETTPTSGVGKIPEPTPEKPDPFPPLPCHVPVVIGGLIFDEAYGCQGPMLLTQRLHPEQVMLTEFSTRAADKDLVTWNGRTFDVPVIILRSLRYGVQLPWYYQRKATRIRYNEEGHFDVMDYISDFGAARNLNLNDAAQLIGLPGKLGVDGSKVWELWETNPEAVENYCMTDVVQTAFVWLRLEYMRGRISLDYYRDVATLLFKKCCTNMSRYGELLGKTDLKTLLLGGDYAGNTNAVAGPDAPTDAAGSEGVDRVHEGDGRDAGGAGQTGPGNEGGAGGVRQDVGGEDSPGREGGV